MITFILISSCLHIKENIFRYIPNKHTSVTYYKNKRCCLEEQKLHIMRDYNSICVKGYK